MEYLHKLVEVFDHSSLSVRAIIAAALINLIIAVLIYISFGNRRGNLIRLILSVILMASPFSGVVIAFPPDFIVLVSATVNLYVALSYGIGDGHRHADWAQLVFAALLIFLASMPFLRYIA